MKFNKKIKKGFTLVELIVVIAIVAILAAVSVVSYIAFINSANESADIQLVKQLNTALQGDQALNGVRKTPTEMLNAMEENGFVIENLTKTKSGYDIVWDQKNNRFALLNGESSVYAESSFNNDSYLNKSLITKLVDNEDEAKTATKLHYSIYLTEAFGDAASLNVSSGLDVGNNVISTINYVNDINHPQTVVIRTNEGTLQVNAPADKIYHYGKMEGGLLKEVAPSSFHERGEAGYINLKKGRLVIEEEAKIEGIYLEDTDGNFDGIKLALVGDAELPTIGRANVEDGMQDGDAKLVVEIQNLETSTGTDENPEYIWIIKEGENVSSTVSSSASDATQTVEKPSEAAAATQEAAEDYAEPVTDNSVARINAKGYESFKEACDAAQKDEKIYLLKDFELNENIGHNADQNGPDQGLGEGYLANEVLLTKDINITLNAEINLTIGGKILLNGHELTMNALSAHTGVNYCQKLFDNEEDYNNKGFVYEGSVVTITEDLEFTAEEGYPGIWFNLRYNGTKWKWEQELLIGGTPRDVRSSKEGHSIRVVESTINVDASATIELNINDDSWDYYSWNYTGTSDFCVSVTPDSTVGGKASLYNKNNFGNDVERIIHCDAINEDGTWQRYYWIVNLISEEEEWC